MHANSCLICLLGYTGSSRIGRSVAAFEASPASQALHGNLVIRFPNRLRAYSGQSVGISEQDVGKL